MGLLDLLKLTKQKKENLVLPKSISGNFEVIGSLKKVDKINRTINRIYRMADGRELLESLSKNQQIKISVDFKDKEVLGMADANHHIHLHKEIYLSTLYHELIHERQHQHNASRVNSLLPEDAFLTCIMCEMDALINTECAWLRDEIKKNSKDLAIYKNDDQSDIGFLYRTYLTEKEKENLSDEAALLLAKKALAMRYFEYLPSIQKAINEIKSKSSTCSEDIIEKKLTENINMSKSEKGHRKNIIRWLLAYQEEFENTSNPAISNHPKADRLEIFDYYKKRLNLDCNYDNIFNRFFDCKIETQQIDEKTKNILKDGKIIASITEQNEGKKINFYYPGSDKIRYSRIEYSKSEFSIKEFDEESQLLMREGEVKDNKFVCCIEYYKTGQVYSRTSYNDGTQIYTNYYERNGTPTERIWYGKNGDLYQHEKFKEGKFIKSKFAKERTIASCLTGLLILAGVAASWIVNENESKIKQTSNKTEYKENSKKSKNDISIQPPAPLIKKDYDTQNTLPLLLLAPTKKDYRGAESNESLSDTQKNASKHANSTDNVNLNFRIQSQKKH